MLHFVRNDNKAKQSLQLQNRNDRQKEGFFTSFAMTGGEGQNDSKRRGWNDNGRIHTMANLTGCINSYTIIAIDT